MIIFISDDNASASIDSHTGRSVELSWPRAMCTESPNEATILPVNLDSVVGSVSDYDVSLIVASDTPGSAEVVTRVSVVTNDLDGI